MIRHRVATLGPPGPTWPRAVARWGSSATLPLDATTCVTAEELRSLVAGAPVSLVIVDPGLPGVDRLLADEVRRGGAALAAVEGPALAAATRRLEPDLLLPDGFGPDALSAALQAHGRSRPAPRPDPVPDAAEVDLSDLVAVTGHGGAGASTVAQALATHLARTGPVLLADLALEADQHLRHGVEPAHDGVFELAEALRHAPAPELTALTVPQPGGYDLLCGLRRRQEWTALSGPVAVQVVDLLRRSGSTVVADVAADLDGRHETGSVDLEDRNGLTRAVMTQATTVVVVGRWSATGIHRLVRTILDLTRHGVERRRIRPVLNGAPRSMARRSTGVRATATLLTDADGEQWPGPSCLPHDRRVEACIREARCLPRRLVDRASRILDGDR